MAQTIGFIHDLDPETDAFISQNISAPPPMMTHHSDGSPPPMQSPPLQTPPAMVQQGQPMMYQQQPNGMNYQQQPGMMQHDPNQQQQQMYGQAPPQQYQGGPQSQGQPQQMQGGGGAGMAQNDGSQFRTATAIPNLGMGPAPVDCPSCGKRAMTRISYHPGNTTQ